MSALSVRISDELTFSLEKICQATERSKGYIVRKALEKYIQDLQDNLIAESEYEKYEKSGKKSVDFSKLATEASIKLKNQ